HRHQLQGKLYRVSVDLTVPGGEIVASRVSDEHHAHEDAFVASRDAFDAVGRRLEDYVRRRKHRVKMHEAPPHGRVAKVMKEEGYGFIDRSDGTEVYFHRNSVLHDAFETLEVGQEVRFAEEMGDKGSQASSVALVGKHHIVE
ncbi:MAG: HPF/RaiA family ribosome-associated protein, partial [Verrucomicrobia bacterium]|nr:HPF/RaiA family ribosome-associated protein [Verrucomicrobiota bacterium]